MKQFLKLALSATLLPMSLFTASNATLAGEYDGLTITVLTRPGPVIAGAIDKRGKEFTEMTGAKVTVIELPFAELFPKILADWSQGTNSIDAAVFSSAWGPELVDMGLIADLSDFVAADEQIQLDDITPYFRDFNQKVNDRTYLLTLDGDFHMFYYRADLLKKFDQQPPKTWDDVFKVAEAIHGKDYNDDGEADYAFCTFKKRSAQSYFNILSVSAPFVQTQGTSQGIFFDTETMAPTINNPGYAEGFRIYKELGKYGPPDELNMDITDIRPVYLSGRCAMLIEWGDTAPLALESGVTKNLWGASQLPGTTKVWNRDTNALEDCNPTLCPYAIDGVNHAPFGAFGGWSAGINANADPKVIEAAYKFFAYMNAPEQSNIDVTQGWTGFNPYRISQFESIDNWVKAGFTEESAKAYLNGLKESLSNPNFASDLRIPGAAQYTSVILDRELARYLADEITAEQAMSNIEEAWEEVTEDFDRDRQAKLYRNTLGIKTTQ